MTSVEEHVDFLARQKGSRPLQILIGIQKAFNCIPIEAIERLSDALDLPVTRILGDVEFYSFLSRERSADYVFLMSDGIIDSMKGSGALYSRLSENLDGMGKVRTGWTSCIGMGDQGPAMLVNGMAMANLDESKIDALSGLVKKSIPLSEWPREWFGVESNIRKRGWLFESREGRLLEGESLLAELDECGLRGRGGAGFPTAKKWASCREAGGDERYVVCNADEGEPGTFKDRELLSCRAEGLLEGMALCAGVIGAKKGFLYVRGEYRYLEAHLESALEKMRFDDFEIELQWGAGAYICGEESALLESIEGGRGIPRIRPPFPVTHGLSGLPTVIDNVETFCAAAAIAAGGGEAFRHCGTAQSRGTKLLSVSGDCMRPGIYEYPFGVSVIEILDDCGAKDTLAVQVGGAAGTCLDAPEFGRTISFEDLPTSGSVMVFDRSRNMKDVALNFARFFAHESCGFCTPCRVGTPLLVEALESSEIEELMDLGQVLQASHCGLGLSASRAVLDMIEHFPGHFVKVYG